MAVTGLYFDGRHALSHEVTLSVAGDRLLLQGNKIHRSEALAVLNIPRPLGNTPRLILFADGARCEIPDLDGFAALLPERGAGLVSGLESRWLYVSIALSILLVLAVAGYHWGLPYAAERVARELPERLVLAIDQHFFANLDHQLLEPSALSVARQQAILAKVQGLKLGAEQRLPTAIEFRASPRLGANAFALPGGTVLVLDDLVGLAANDDEVVAVLAHEIGHVNERHPLRQMLQASVVGLAVAWYFGDVSSVLLAAPTLLLQSAYSRDFERQADAFAADLLARNGLSPAILAGMLEKLETAAEQRSPKLPDSAEKIGGYLSTHPDTQDRIRQLRYEAQAGGNQQP